MPDVQNSFRVPLSSAGRINRCIVSEDLESLDGRASPGFFSMSLMCDLSRCRGRPGLFR